MPETKQRATIEAVHAALRADLITGVHPPGERLKFAPLCERYGASVSVVREALTRLEQQGLVESEPRIGFRVRQVSVEDLDDLTETRIDVETLALRHAIEHGDIDWETALVAAHHRLERTAMLSDDDPPQLRDDWESAHVAFHDALLAGCTRRWLLGMARTLRDAGEFYRRLSQVHEPDRDVAGEHRGLLDAALARDADEATRLLREHYERTAAIVRDALE
ncbi:GntR family transcriptional regulator [Calidifontibacter sp. DB0510]|uniref:GntR family transcriptional regulator n=1 Tax=Metallococcus carri TaxID=1656884 RepID=A0A967AWD1_9MICO|nr:GntR family transcriptional regulator [Metallococcus carri]NHN54179.1 GntR family transcriptional regulator [Metallococcus carri]NOP36981.1 GntR family transcriptional regulator [Calidifontibacter sp. DB2511S]